MASFSWNNAKTNLGNLWNAGDEVTREIGSRVFNGNTYDMQDPWRPDYRKQVLGSSTTASNVGNGTTIQDHQNLLARPGGGGGGGGGSSPSYSREDLAYIDGQLAALNNQYGRLDTTERNSLDAVEQRYNQQLGETNQARGRAIEDFNTKFQVSDQGRQKSLGQVETNARTLADSLRRRIGMASGSGSSAYQVTAPGAVAQQASDQRANVLDDYSQNFLALETDKKRAEEDFEKALTGLSNWKNESTMGVKNDIGLKRNEITEAQGRAAGERAKLMNGGYAGIRSAMAPYEQQINERNSFLDGLYDKYASKYQAKPVQVANTQLRDYAVDKAAVADNTARGNTNETAPYRTYLDEEENVNPLY